MSGIEQKTLTADDRRSFAKYLKDEGKISDYIEYKPREPQLFERIDCHLKKTKKEAAPIVPSHSLEISLSPEQIEILERMENLRSQVIQTLMRDKQTEKYVKGFSRIIPTPWGKMDVNYYTAGTLPEESVNFIIINPVLRSNNTSPIIIDTIHIQKGGYFRITKRNISDKQKIREEEYAIIENAPTKGSITPALIEEAEKLGNVYLCLFHEENKPNIFSRIMKRLMSK